MNSQIVALIALGCILVYLSYPYKCRYYFERTLIFFGFCPNCKKFSMQRIKDYSVCTICRKR